MAYGVTSSGFVPKPLAVIKAEIQASYQAVFGAGVNLGESTVNGQMIGLLADREAQLWTLGQALYNLLDPDVASDTALDNILAITGLQRLAAVKSTAIAVLIGTNATVVPLGTQLATAGAAVPFLTDAAATIATISAWTGSQTWVAGNLRTNDSGKIYYCTQGGAGAGAGGPTGTGTAIVDGAAVWRYVGTGTAAVAQTCTARDYGATTAIAGSLTAISTPVAGLASVVNPLDATVGRAVETDAAARIRRAASLHSTGNAAADAVRAAILAINGVTSCNLLVNDGDVNDGNGLTPHSIEAIVQGGLDALVAAAVFKKGAGIGTNGNSGANVTDSQGNTQFMKFTRPTPKNIYVSVTASLSSSFDTVGGPARVKANLVAFALGTLLDAVGKQIFAGYKPGDSVIQSALYQAVFKEPGINDVSALFIGTAPGPTLPTTITCLVRELATFDTSRILFNGA
jgi:uncharacterized phage protein gp47/JayE